MARCPVCGATVNDSDTVCRFCGAKIAEERKAAEERRERRESLTGVMHQLDDETLLRSVKAKLYGLNGIERNPDEAFKLCEELANRGNIEGIYLLGQMKYDAGDMKTAYKLWRFAAKRGHEPSKLKVETAFDSASLRGTKGAAPSFRAELDEELEEEDGGDRDVGDGSAPIDSVVMIIAGNSCGSGFLTPDHYVITNAHVVGNNETAMCFFHNQMTNDGRATRLWKLDVLDTYPEYDLAVLEFQESTDIFDRRGLPSAENVRLEEKVKTIGYPLGLPFSVSKGIVSNTSQNLGDGGEYHYKVHDMIQTDISINSGNSGGPLINTAGEVVGVISCRPTEANGGIGFAIPIRYVDKILDDFR